MTRPTPWFDAIVERLLAGPADPRELVLVGAAYVPPGMATRQWQNRRDWYRGKASSSRSEAYREARRKSDPVVIGSRHIARQTINGSLRRGRFVRLPDGRVALREVTVNQP